jgi:dTDP-L-rhamnose 4-epimerase
MILVTGGAGFIGSHIVDLLIFSGQRVRVLDALLPGAHRERPLLHPDAEFIEGDVRDAETLNDALDGVTAVCHQASMVGLGASILNLPEYVAHNDFGTAVLLAELARIGFEGRLVAASSVVVYGDGRYRCGAHGLVRPAPRELDALASGLFEVGCPTCGSPLRAVAVREDTPPDPRDLYADTKVHQEHLCGSFARETGVPVTVLRYQNVYGPRMPRDTPHAGVAAIFRSALAAGNPARVFEDGRQLRDFVHVRDVARANVIALTAKRPIPGIFNVASGEPRTVLEMAQVLSAAFPGAKPPVITGEFRRGDARHVFASTELALDALGFNAQERFEAGMAEFAHAPLRA